MQVSPGTLRILSRRAYAPPFIEARCRARAAEAARCIAARVRAALHRGDYPRGPYGATGFRSRRAYAPPFIEAPLAVFRAVHGRPSRRAYAPPFIEACSTWPECPMRYIAARVRAALHRGAVLAVQALMSGSIAARVRAALHRGGAPACARCAARCHRGARTRRPSSRPPAVPGLPQPRADRGARTRRPSSRQPERLLISRPGASRRAYAPPFIEARRRSTSRRDLRGRSRRAYAPPFIEASICGGMPSQGKSSRRAYAPPFIEAPRSRCRTGRWPAPIAARVRAALHRGRSIPSTTRPGCGAIAARVRAALHRGWGKRRLDTIVIRSRRAYAPPFIEAGKYRQNHRMRWYRSRRAYAPPFIEARPRNRSSTRTAGTSRRAYAPPFIEAAADRSRASGVSTIAARVRAALHRGQNPGFRPHSRLQHRGARTRRPSSRPVAASCSGMTGRYRGARTRRPSSRLHVERRELSPGPHRGARTRRPSSRQDTLTVPDPAFPSRRAYAPPFIEAGRRPWPPGRRHLIAARVRAALHRGEHDVHRAPESSQDRGARTRRPSSRPVQHPRRGPSEQSRRAYAPPFIEATRPPPSTRSPSPIAARVRAALHRGQTSHSLSASSGYDRGARTRRPSSRRKNLRVRVQGSGHRGARTRRPSSRQP